MAEQIFKELKTKIALKYLDFATWSAESFKSEKPLKGEVWFCEIPSNNAEATNAPTMLFKVGDGVNTFGALNWCSALAADVHAWAKKSETEFITWVNTVVEHPVITWDDVTGKPDFGAIYKTRQNAYSAEGSTVKTVTKVAQNENGEVEITYADIAFPAPVDISGKKDKQEAYSAAGATTKTITKVEQTVNGEVSVTYEDIAFPTKIAEADHADAAAKVDHALTVKVGGANVVFDGSAEKTADVDAAIEAAIDAIPEVVHPEYSIIKDATSEYAATYHLTKDGVNVGTAINIPKDLVVESGKVETLEAGVWGEAGTYIILTLANATNDKIYVRVDSLIEYVTSGSTVDSQVIVSIDDNHKVTATIGAGKITETELADSVKVAIAKDDNTTYSFANKAGTDLTFTVTPSEGDTYDVTLEAGELAKKDTIATGDIDDKAVTEGKLEQNVQDALALARTALQDGNNGDTATIKADVVTIGTNNDGVGYGSGLTIQARYHDGAVLTGGENVKLQTAFGIGAEGTLNLHTEGLDLSFVKEAVTRSYNFNNEGAITFTKGEVTKTVAYTEDLPTDHLTEVTAGTGLKVTNKNNVEIDEEVIFILNANF